MGWADAPVVNGGDGWKAAPKQDAMGFPVEPQGGVTTNSKAVAELGSGLGATFQGIHNGAFMGFGDNLNGVIAALAGANPLNPSEYFGAMDDRYAQERDRYREIYRRNQETNPVELGVGNLTGAMIPAVASIPYATGNGLLGTMAKGAGIGAVEGGIQGAGYADGQDVAGSALRGAGIGGVAGAAIPGLIALARSGIMDPITGGIDAAINRVNKGKAARAVAGALRKSGKTEAEIAAILAQAADEGQPMFSLMDAIGVAGQRQASGVARGGGDAATEIADYLASRQAGQSERVGGFVEDAFGFNGKGSGQTLPLDPRRPVPLTSSQILSGPQISAAQTAENLTKARSEAANLAYDAARKNAAPVDVRGALAVIDDRIGGMSGSGIAGDSIDGKLAGYRARLAGSGSGLGPDVTGAELSDFNRVLGVKQSVQDDIGAAVRAGRNNEARELTKLANELDAALEASSDMYRTANDQFRAASRVVGAIDDGSRMAAKGRAADNIPSFQQMNEDMRAAARIGYGDRLLADLEKNAAVTANKAKPLSQSPKRAAEASVIALEPDLYARRLARENAMWETQNRALGGSRTADNQADIAGLAGGVAGAAKSALAMNVGDAMAKVAGLLAPIAKSQNSATRQYIARALMANDIAAIVPLVRRELKDQMTSRAIEALIRNAISGVGR